MQKMIKIVIMTILSFILLNSIVGIGLAVYKSIHGYILIIQGRIEERPGVYMMESLDAFLISIFLLVFAIGIAKLFLPGTSFIRGYDLPWLKVESFSALKFILWEVLLTTLVVFFATSLVINKEHLDWTMLIIPVSILALSLAYRFLKQEH
jgi:uncharacterized membrane protein YqhA